MNRQKYLLISLLIIFALPCIIFLGVRVINKIVFSDSKRCYIGIILNDTRNCFLQDEERFIGIYKFTAASQSQYNLGFRLSQREQKPHFFYPDISPKYSFFRGIWAVEFYIIAFSDGTLAISDSIPDNFDSLKDFRVITHGETIEDIQWFTSRQRNSQRRSDSVEQGTGVSMLIGFSNDNEQYDLICGNFNSSATDVLPSQNEKPNGQTEVN